MFSLLVTVLALLLHFLSPTTATPTHLNLTAITAAQKESTLECWQLSAPFVVSGQAGTSGSAITQLGATANASYVILPPEFDGGVHHAPAVQYVVFLSGLAHVTFPNSTEEAWILGGRHGLIIAADTAAVSALGHITTYPGREETIAMQIPTADGLVPPHSVLYPGPCKGAELGG